MLDNYKHGNAKRGHRTALYEVWYGMRRRCSYSKANGYANYGARGIKVCQSWQNSFIEFEAWAKSNGYKEGLVLDRINNDGDYEPNNCRFVTYRTNNQNTRTFRFGTSLDGNRFRAKIKFKGKMIHLGRYDSREEAERAYVIAANLAEQGIKPTIEAIREEKEGE